MRNLFDIDINQKITIINKYVRFYYENFRYTSLVNCGNSILSNFIFSISTLGKFLPFNCDFYLRTIIHSVITKL